jgi:TrmH family RNA methyltransferase
MLACTSTEAPQGFVAVVPMAPPAAPPRPPSTLAVIADGIADPGNLGTLLRTAWAAGVDVVFLSPGTVDAYNPKVVRSAMGAHFALPLVSDVNEAILQQLAGLPLWLAQPRGGLAYDQLDARQALAFVVGQEAHGPGEFWRKRAAGAVSVPMDGRVESLNAAIAAAIILFEVRRQRGTALGRASHPGEDPVEGVPQGTASSVPEENP